MAVTVGSCGEAGVGGGEAGDCMNEELKEDTRQALARPYV